ncbi:MAG: hypothetical protein KBD76_00750 [Bacteriovorax sp.]|nr:hypothetical protein [Bacteriovorax sp.]
MLKSLVFFSSIILFNTLHALEIDEKLTLRFLKVSSSKKTILINRGAEDGLAVGDHAKFFRTTGVIARGVVEKISPSRSIWSLYRIVDSAEIENDLVLNLKIASPVKITVDPSKSMKDSGEEEGTEIMDINAPETSEAGLAGDVTESEKKELEDLQGDEEGVVGKASKDGLAQNKLKKNNKKKKEELMEEVLPNDFSFRKAWEFWGTFYVNSLSGTQESSTAGVNTASTATVGSTIDFSAGIEHYFLKGNDFFKETSLMLFLHKRTIETGQDLKLTSDWMEYGVGFNYHFYNPPFSVGRPIAFVSFDGGFGNTNLIAAEASSGTEVSVKGTNTFFSLGLGAKYFLQNGFGARALLDYYSSSESYDYPSEVTVKRTLAGPRIQLGVSYRF